MGEIAICVAELLARVIAAIRITGARRLSYLLSKTHKLVLIDPIFAVLPYPIAQLVFIRITVVPCGTAEWPARVDRIR